MYVPSARYYNFRVMLPRIFIGNSDPSTLLGMAGMASLSSHFGFCFSTFVAIKYPYPQIHHDRQN